MKLRIARKINDMRFKYELGIEHKRHNYYMYKKAISTISKRTHKWKLKYLKNTLWQR